MKNVLNTVQTCGAYDAEAEYFNFVAITGSKYANYRFVKEMIAQLAPDIYARVGGYGPTHVEIIGPLPRQLRRGLRQAVMWSYPLPRKSRKEPAGLIVYRTGHAGDGLAFNIPNWAALADLLIGLSEIHAAKTAAKDAKRGLLCLTT